MAIDTTSLLESENRTTDGVFGTSAAETILVALTVQGGAAETVAEIHDGTSTSGDTMELITALLGTTVTAHYGPGLHLPNGCYLNITTTGGSVTAHYRQ